MTYLLSEQVNERVMYLRPSLRHVVFLPFHSLQCDVFQYLINGFYHYILTNIQTMYSVITATHFIKMSILI